MKFEANERDVKRIFDVDKKARHIHAMKLRLNEDVQERYFDEVEKDEIEN